MLSHATLPKIYWAEALMMVVYIINKSPSVPLEGSVPQKVWSDNEVSYMHLKVFRCLAYVHVAKDQRGNLIPRVDHVYFSATVKTNSAIDYGM